MKKDTVTISLKEFIKRLSLSKKLWHFGAGSLLILMLLIQIITGIFLAMFYVPTADLAFDSIIHIIRNIKSGELLRNAHAIGASLFFLACYLHIFRALYYNVYRRPYIKMWFISVSLYLLIMITAFLGYSLIWGQRSYWAATVITGFAKAIPFIGDTLHEYVTGGFAVGTPTLGRFYVFHFLIPLFIVLLSIIHIRTVKVAFADAMKKPLTPEELKHLLFNYHLTLGDFIKMTLFLMLFTWGVFFIPNALSHVDNFVKADPTVTPALVSPEWYFLTLFSILRCFSNELVGLGAMALAVGVFFLLPWLDTSKARFRNRSPIVILGFWLWILNAMFLGWLGSKALVGPSLMDWVLGTGKEAGWIRPASQLSTLFYFAYFFILMPLRFYLEKQD